MNRASDPSRPVWSRLPVVALGLLAAVPCVVIPLEGGGLPGNATNSALAIASLAAIYAAVALPTAMFAYLSGLPSIAQAGLWGLGAYAAAIAMQRWGVNFWLTFPLAIAVSSVVAFPTALIALRTTGVAFLVVTLAFAEFVVILVSNADDLTGGTSGMPFEGSPGKLGPIDFEDPVTQYYLYLVVIAIAGLVYWLVRRSEFGQRMQAVRDNPELARSVSLNARLHRLVLFQISAAVTGLVSPLILMQQHVITPDLFNSGVFINVFLMIMLGGMATIAGPILGAWVVQFLPEWIASAAGSIDPNVQYVVRGALLVFVVLAARRGIMGQISYLYRSKVLHTGELSTVRVRSRPTASVPSPAPAAMPRALSAAEARALSARPEARELSSEIALDIRRLSHNFGSNQALDGVSLEVRAAEVRGLIGPNGSGKTTLLNCVSGFLRPADADVVFRGEQIGRCSVESSSTRGLVRSFQQPEVFPSFTARQTVTMVLSSVGSLGGGKAFNADLPDDPEFYLDLCALTEVADLPPSSLSYGHTRLLGVAAALARRPYVLMLDEPAAGLAANDRGRLAQVILRAQEANVAVILIDHDMSFLLPLCDRLTVLDYGRKICEGEPAEVTCDTQVVEAYLGSGFAKRLAPNTAPETLA